MGARGQTWPGIKRIGNKTAMESGQTGIMGGGENNTIKKVHVCSRAGDGVDSGCSCETLRLSSAVGRHSMTAMLRKKVRVVKCR